MINTLILENFQIHKKTEMSFGPGVNIITGQSDNGKSSIVRALRWAIQNRPSGTGILRTDSKEDTAVRILFAEGTGIARVRGTKNNYYICRAEIEGETDKLQALRSDVPTEISSIVNISPHSLQGQHDPYFLLQLSSGEAAKLFGELADLSIIAKTTSAANKYIKSIKEQQGALVAEEQKMKNDFFAFSYLDEALPIAEELQKCTNALIDSKKTVESLEILVGKLSTIQSEMAALRPHSAAKQALAGTVTCIETLGNIRDKVTLLLKIFAALHGINTAMAAIAPRLELYKKHTEDANVISAITKRAKECRCTVTALEKAIKANEEEEKKYNEILNNLEKTKREFAEAKQQCPVCPLCNKPWGDV